MPGTRFFPITSAPIQVAPLRERREDVPLLALHFIKFSVKEMGCAKPRLTRAGIIELQGYDWPGKQQARWAISKPGRW